MNYFQQIEAFYQRLVQLYPAVQAAVRDCLGITQRYDGSVSLSSGGGYEGVAAVYLLLKNRSGYVTTRRRRLIDLWESTPIAKEFLERNFGDQIRSSTQLVSVGAHRRPLMELLLNAADSDFPASGGGSQIIDPFLDPSPEQVRDIVSVDPADPFGDIAADPEPGASWPNLTSWSFTDMATPTGNQNPFNYTTRRTFTVPSPAPYSTADIAQYEWDNVGEFVPTAPPPVPEETVDESPEEPPSEFYLRTTYGGRTPESQIRWDIRDEVERSRRNIVPLLNGGYAPECDTSNAVKITPDGGYKIGKLLYTEAAGSVFVAVSWNGPDEYPSEILPLFGGESILNNPPAGWVWVDGNDGSKYLFQDRFGMTEVPDPYRPQRTTPFPTPALAMLGHLFGTLYDTRDSSDGRTCVRHSRVSFTTNVAIRGRGYYVREYCNRCQTQHDTYAFTAQCAAARAHRHMSQVQGYHGVSTINVYWPHRRRRNMPPSSRLDEYTVGFEVEKNYVVNLDGSTAGDRGHYVDNTPLFSRWERDGSCGVEGITHAYSVERYRLFKSHVMSSRHLLDGGVDRLRGPERENDNRRRYTCGGHITLVGPKVNMQSVRRYAGLLYSLYKKRLRNGYCADNKDLGDPGRSMHYCAIREREQRNSVEFRLVRRVETHTNMLWRFRLFRKLAKAIDTDMSYKQFLSECRPLLNEVFNKNKVREILADAKHFDDYINRGFIHSRISEYI